MATYGPMVLTSAGQALYAKVQTGTTLTFTRMQVGSGQLATTLTNALTSGTSYSSLSVAALPRSMSNGDTVTIGVGGTSQNVTLSASAAANATAINVNTFTANAAYASGTLVTDITDAASLTALITPVEYFDITTESTSGSTANIRGIYQNKNFTASTYTCEIGLFAQDPTAGEILYAYGNAGSLGDTFPPYSSGPFSRQFQIATAVGNAASVTANVPSTVYVPQSDVGVTVASLVNGQVPASQLGNAPAPANATSTTPGLVEVVENTTTPIVPTRVASFQEAEITSTSAQTVLTYTPQANHNFELGLSFRVITATTTVTIDVTYTDAGGAETYYVLDAQSCVVDNYACVPFSFNATTGGAITVSVTASIANQVYVSGSLKAV